MEGEKAKEVENTGFKLWNSRKVANKNGVGILIDKTLKDGVVDVKRQGDRTILVKPVLGDVVLNIISAYAPRVGLNESEKRQFWEDLDGMVRAVATNEKLFIEGDLNGHVGSINADYELAHRGFWYGSRNQVGEDILDFVVTYNLVIANTFFRKRYSHLVTFRSGHRSSQIDFVLIRREVKQACLDCKVIPRESVVPQHNLVVADFRFQICAHRDKHAKIARTKWWKLKGETSKVFRERVFGEDTWSEEDANNMLVKMATCIRKMASELFGVTKGSTGEPKDTWWWTEDI
ncbi:Craniofacial development protein 2 [Zea mays]|uniref:Craniofacial development protein 2 n=1 Tax=Zea mays TaxID=4577 RepID=A0A3L6E7T0_MAIZE|nr:Craniofacial development protein 2 [Zea mays]